MNNLPQVVDDLLPAEHFRGSIMAVQADMLRLPQVECTLVHHFCNGVYGREITIPAGTLIIGKIHKHECLNVLLKGEITVITETGKVRLTAPYTFVSPAGTKKAAFTHTEVIWSNFMATASTDPEEIEREFVCDTYEDAGFLAHVKETLQLKE